MARVSAVVRYNRVGNRTKIREAEEFGKAAEGCRDRNIHQRGSWQGCIGMTRHHPAWLIAMAAKTTISGPGTCLRKWNRFTRIFPR